MKTLPRLTRFALVGALGIAVQLAALALFNRFFAGRYLLASAAAIELAVLHNFVWHLRYTWRDRRSTTTPVQQLVRFHLSNGVVSLAGNLALMRLLVQTAHLPLLAANILAIAACGAANFALADLWSFHPRPMSVTLMLLLGIASAHAQSAPNPDDQYSHGLGTDCAYENIFAGPVLASKTSLTGTAGVTFGQYFARSLGKGLGASPQFELGVVGPLPGGRPLDGLVSAGYIFANKLPHRGIYPFAALGYTRVFTTGNAANFGIGVDFGKDEYKHLYRIELRDYYLFTGPRQHVVGLRIGIGSFISD